MTPVTNTYRPSQVLPQDIPPPWWRPLLPYAGALVAAGLGGTAVILVMGPPDLGPLKDIALTDSIFSFNLEHLSQWLFFSTDGLELYYLIGVAGFAGLAALAGIKRALRRTPLEAPVAARPEQQAAVQHVIGDKAGARRHHGGPIRN